MMKIFLLKLGFFLSGLIWGVYALAAQPLQNKHLSGGLVHSLYIDSTGNVWVWGGSSLDGVSNELIPSIAMKEGRSAHSNFDSNTTFVIKQDGSLWGWGNTIAGQLRLFPKDDRMNSAFIDIPREILSHAIAVNGDGSIFAIKPDHSLWVWGHWGAQRGDAGRKDTLIPRKVMNDVVQVSSTNYHTLALQKDGTLWAWVTTSAVLWVSATGPNTSTPSRSNSSHSGNAKSPKSLSDGASPISLPMTGLYGMPVNSTSIRPSVSIRLIWFPHG